MADGILVVFIFLIVIFVLAGLSIWIYQTIVAPTIAADKAAADKPAADKPASGSITCMTTSPWSPTTVAVGGTTTKQCPNGTSTQTATCQADGTWGNFTADCPAAAGGSGAATYSSFANTDIGGTDLPGGVPGSLSSCKALCDATTGCTGFVIDAPANTKYCFLKKLAGNETPRYDTTFSYYYKGTAPSLGAAKAPSTSSTCAGIPNTTNVYVPWLTVNNSSNYYGDGQIAGSSNIIDQCKVVYSNNKSKALVMQSDGNLVIYNLNDNSVFWASNTKGIGTGPYKLSYTPGGGLGVMDSTGTWTWNADLGTNSGRILVMQDDGNLVVYSGYPTSTVSNGVLSLTGGSPIWSSRKGKLT